jgi:hypothetical protein
MNKKGNGNTKSTGELYGNDILFSNLYIKVNNSYRLFQSPKAYKARR